MAQVHRPQRVELTAPACALQGASDRSSSEGSTVDFLDAEEILKKIPELADDLDEPDDCFTEGKVAATGLLTLAGLGPESGSALTRAPVCPGPPAASLPGVRDQNQT